MEPNEIDPLNAPPALQPPQNTTKRRLLRSLALWSLALILASWAAVGTWLLVDARRDLQSVKSRTLNLGERVSTNEAKSQHTSRAVSSLKSQIDELTA